MNVMRRPWEPPNAQVITRTFSDGGPEGEVCLRTSVFFVPAGFPGWDGGFFG